MDALIHIITDELAAVVVSLILAALTALGALALDQLRLLIGEQRTKVLRDILDPAIARGIARAQAQGLTGDALAAAASAYLADTMGDTLKRLNAPPSALRERIAAQAGPD
jgi:hypothetical protein